MTFTLHGGGVYIVMPRPITHTIIKHTPFSPYIPAHWFSVVAFHSLSQPHNVTATHPSPGDKHQNTGERSERTQGQAKLVSWNSFSYLCTRALYSYRSFAHWCAASTVIPLLPKATLTPSIQPNLGLPRTRPPLTSAIETLLAKRYSSILSTFQNHLNTLCNTLV